MLREPGCSRAAARAQVAAELSDVDRLRAMDERRSPQTMTRRGSLVSSLLGNDDDGNRIELAETLSNVGVVSLLGWQLLSDLSLHDRAGLPDSFGWELMVADLLAHGLAQGLSFAMREAAMSECALGDQACEAGAASPSGRTAMAFTSAGLMCVHRQMAGVGSGECLGALALASAVGAMRVMTEEHDMTDVLVSALVGIASGYVAPMAALYAFGARPPSTRERTEHEHRTEDDHRADWGVRANIGPSFSSSRGVGLRVQGSF